MNQVILHDGIHHYASTRLNQAGIMHTFTGSEERDPKVGMLMASDSTHRAARVVVTARTAVKRMLGVCLCR